MGRTTAAALVVAVVAGGLAVARGQAQGPSGSQDIMPALLAEVRGLRAAMEQMASAGARVQLALGRLQLQEQRLNTAISRLDNTRARLADAQRGAADQQGQLAMMETELKEPKDDGPPREDVERTLHHLRQQASQSAMEMQRLAAEEAMLAGEVANEQGRWTGFNQRLEELERTLGGR